MHSPLAFPHRQPNESPIGNLAKAVIHFLYTIFYEIAQHIGFKFILKQRYQSTPILR
jgi:hypothetical protein